MTYAATMNQKDKISGTLILLCLLLENQIAILA
jgi:hypothetical protein